MKQIPETVSWLQINDSGSAFLIATGMFYDLHRNIRCHSVSEGSTSASSLGFASTWQQWNIYNKHRLISKIAGEGNDR